MLDFFLCFWDPKNVFQTRSSGIFAWVSSECQFQLCTKAASVTGKAAFSFSSKLELKKQIKKGWWNSKLKSAHEKNIHWQILQNSRRLKNFKPFFTLISAKTNKRSATIFFHWPIFFTLTAWNFGDTPRSWPSYLWRHLDWLHVRWKQSQNRQNNMKYAH